MISMKKKAKKRLIGSFSKRKKLRLVDGTSATPSNNNNNDDCSCDIDEDAPPPLPKSRPPIPEFHSDGHLLPSLSSVSREYIHLTSSLPANLDRASVDNNDVPLSPSSSSTSFDDDNINIPTDCSSSVDYRLQATNDLRSSSIFRDYNDEFLMTSLSGCSETSSSSGSPLPTRAGKSRTFPVMITSSPMDTTLSSPDTPPTQTRSCIKYNTGNDNTNDNNNNNNNSYNVRDESVSFISLRENYINSKSSDASSYVTSFFSGIGKEYSDDSDTYCDIDYDIDRHNNDDDDDMNDDTDGEGTLILDEDRILTADIGIFEEVFEPRHEDVDVDALVTPLADVKGQGSQRDKNYNDFDDDDDDEDDDDDDSTLDFTISSEDDLLDNLADEVEIEKEASTAVFSQTYDSSSDSLIENSSQKDRKLNSDSVSKIDSKPISLYNTDLDCRSNSQKNSNTTVSKKESDITPVLSPQSKTCRPFSPTVRTTPKDSKILNKIQFFETISDSDKTENIHKSSAPEPKRKELFSDRNNIAAKEPLISQTDRLRSTLPLHTSASVSRRGKSDMCTTSSVTDNSRGAAVSDNSRGLAVSRSNDTRFFSSGVSSPRMNFSRFRKSGSIPESKVVCECGKGCEYGCPGSKGRRDIEDNNEDEDEDDDEENESDGEDKSEEAQVCHHPRCTEDNKDTPLLLCRPCDASIHRQPEYQGHLVLDYNKKRHIVIRHPSPSPSATYDAGSDSDTTPCSSNSSYITPGNNNFLGDYDHLDSKDQFDDVDGLKLFVKHSTKQRNKSPTELNRKLKRKKALKKKSSHDKTDGLEAALAQIANPEGLPLDPDMANMTRADSDGPSDSGTSNDATNSRRGSTSGAPRKDSMDSNGGSDSGLAAGVLGRMPMRRQSRVHDAHFTLKFTYQGDPNEDVEVVAAVHNTTLREAIEHTLLRRGLEVENVHVFIEKSKTPLPLSSDCSFLAGNTLEIKEKDEKDGEVGGGSVKQRSTSASKGSGKAAKGSGRNSRRDSVGVVPVLLEPPPSTKQRRGSLQLPFREHFFTTKNEPKTADVIKGYDDVFGSLRGRNRGANLSVDDTYAISSSSSPGGTWNEGKAKTKGQKLSVVSLFGPANKDREKQEQLHEILNRYSSQGLPSEPDLLALGRRKFDEAIFDMESHWKELVDNHETMVRKDQEHQEAVWELLNTEVSYLRQIRVIIDVFQNCLINIQQEGLLNEIETERLFSNIDKIYECNALFWQQYLLPVLLQARKSRQPVDIVSCKEAFTVHFPNMFQVYFRYFIEHKACLDYAKSCTENGELFKSFISWAETQKPCNRLKMGDIMVKPMQRLLKYSLLLQAVLKHTENERDKNNLRDMIVAVDKLCWAANTSLQRREDFEKLEAVRKTIDNYDAIEAPNDECTKIIQEFNGNFNLLAPMQGFRDGQPRNQLFKSTLRMKEAQATKVDVDILLFTDLTLICKSNRKMDRFKVIRPPMRLDQLVLNELKDKGSFLLIYMNEYHVPISAYTFHGDVAVIKTWIERFREAQKDYKRRKIEESAELERIRASAIPLKEEVEYTPLNSIQSGVDMAGFPRSESIESTDFFVPNLLAPDATPMGRCSSTGDIQHRLNNTPSSLEQQQLFSPNVGGGSTGRITSSVLDHNVISTDDANGRHRFVQSCNSVPVFPLQSTTTGGHSNSLAHQQFLSQQHHNLPAHIYNTDNVSPHLQQSADSSLLFTSQTSLSSEPSSVFDDELSKIKLNSRRVSRSEKRYHTADAIEDLKNQEKDKDASIHKRLSMRTENYGEDEKNLGSKLFNSDSIRSIPSSSGVSSTGSLHFNMESNISEEAEGFINNNNNNSSMTTTTSVMRAGMGNNVNMFIHDTVDIHTANNNRINQGLSSSQSNSLFSKNCSQNLNNNEHYNNEDDDDSNLDDDTGSDLCPQTKQSKSKSTPDLAAMFSNSLQVSQMEDGIASAKGIETFHRKLTHADIMKMKRLKQQILYDANIESSEV